MQVQQLATATEHAKPAQPVERTLAAEPAERAEFAFAAWRTKYPKSTRFAQSTQLAQFPQFAAQFAALFAGRTIEQRYPIEL